MHQIHGNLARAGWFASVAFFLVVAVGATLSQSPQRAEAVDFDVGHVDAFHISLEGQTLTLLFANEAGGVEELLAPGDVTMVVRPSAQTTVPGGGSFSFLGSPGAPIWVLPQVQNPQLLRPGLSAEELSASDWQSLELRLLSVSGPGQFRLFQTDAFGSPIHLWDSAPDSFNVDPGSHVHFNWAFTAPGTYAIGVQAAGTHAQLGQLSSAAVTYHVNVQSNALPTNPPAAGTTPPPGGSATTPPTQASPGPGGGGSQGQSSLVTPPSTGDAGLISEQSRGDAAITLLVAAVAGAGLLWRLRSITRM